MSLRFAALAFIAMLTLAHVPCAQAHDATPALLELRARESGDYSVVWISPARNDAQLRMRPVFASGCDYGVQRTDRSAVDVVRTEGVVRCKGGLAGKLVEIEGLEATMSDALVRVHHADGAVESHVLRPTLTAVELGGITSRSALASDYLILGATHVLGGADHLLFLLGLVLIVPGTRKIVTTVTTFTVAHSITLGAATLGFSQVALLPLNFAIALSILALGPEIVRARRGEHSLSIDKPWLLALIFGLVHGFGFASGLSTVGLPHAAIPFALLWFNVGVEVGQIGFIAATLLLLHSFKVLGMSLARPVMHLPAYVVGSVGAYWAIQSGTRMLDSMSW